MNVLEGSTCLLSPVLDGTTDVFRAVTYTESVVSHTDLGHSRDCDIIRGAFDMADFDKGNPFTSQLARSSEQRVSYFPGINYTSNKSDLFLRHFGMTR